MSKKENGITLIALVITIIILLILAGVTLSTVLGGNGLFGRARNAADTYKNKEELQSDTLNMYENEYDKVYHDYVTADPE